ncbi:hypothetical protein FRUB_09071 [Fimbriiglobus ruber]|uniref:Uncharacterized protein n=1 Tax=Fimbriiglobus ruber TaxID=1908690 RepID=A0A225DDA5_9BACT|nr:hypothetical protein FRUB_09071 [Fimbriiglobus ruber]
MPEEPRALPPSVTGALPRPTPPVSPAAGTSVPSASVAETAAAPIARFHDLSTFPPETVQAVYSMRAGAAWLYRMNQANGRFLYGLNPALRMPLAGDNDFRQALAALALAEAARFTGEQELSARATQAVMVLLTLTKPDPSDPTCRVPEAPSDRCNRVGLAAVLALAAYQIPDAKLHAEAESLCAFLRKQCCPNGAINHTDTPTDDPGKTDPEGACTYPGLALRAIAVSHRAKPEAWKRDAAMRATVYYRSTFRAQPTAALAATLIHGCVEFYFANGKDAASRDAAFEMADWLCACQHTRADARVAAWAGGFKAGQAPAQASLEPGVESATCAAALVAAAKLTRQVPDLARFNKYRAAAVDGLAFARGLQFTEESAEHFERAFRARFLTGGVHLTPTNGLLRVDATALVVDAQLAFLESGAEARAE